MIATVKLYKSCRILDDKNYMVDELESYLNTLSNTLTYTINYFKFDKKEPVLKLQLRQENIEMLQGNDYNYVSIWNEPTVSVNPNTRKYYYFVTNKIWKSENCVELQLKLDSLNTVKWNVDYTVSKRTKVLREHRDRFKYLTPTELKAQGFIDINVKWKYIDADLYYGEITLNPNPALVGLVTYNVTVDTGNIDDEVITTLNTTTGSLYIKINSVTQGIRHCYYTVYATYPNNKLFVKVVDPIPEGINPILYKGKEENIIQEIDTSWNLIYKNQSDPSPDSLVNPVECYACPDTPLKAQAVSSSRDITYSSLTDNIYYFVGSSNNGSLELSFKDNANNEYTISFSEAFVPGAYGYTSSKYLILHKVADQNYFSITYEQYVYSSSRGGPTVERTTTLIEATNITSLSVLSAIEDVNYATNNSDTFSPTTTTVNGSFTFSTTEKYVNSLESVDRTDSKLIKIFKLPYAPSKVTVNNDDTVTLDDNWDYDTTSSLFKLKNLNAKFNYEFTSLVKDPINELFPDFIPIARPLITPRDIKYETKLLNSEFYSPKFVYDSFSFRFDLERIDILKSIAKMDSEYFKLGFVMTTTINSKFMFYFPNYELIDFLKTQDYDKYLSIARNNEVVLYNSQYINYIRTGYNYDLKSKDRTQLSSGLGLGLGITGSLATMGLGLASGNPAVAIGGIIGGVSSIISNVVSTINTISSSEMSIASKLEQLKNQAVSVSGSDDIDLLEFYSNNRGKLTEWRCSDNMRNAIYDLFYYCGYATNEMKIPNLYTRLWFNFIQAELEINESNNLPDFVTNDLIERFKNGVTVMHCLIDQEQVKNWDFDQEKENWEELEI